MRLGCDRPSSAPVLVVSRFLFYNEWLGLPADYEHSSVNSDGTADQVKLYGIGNLYYEFLDGSKVDVAGTSFKQRNDRFWGGVGLGGSCAWGNTDEKKNRDMILVFKCYHE